MLNYIIRILGCDIAEVLSDCAFAGQFGQDLDESPAVVAMGGHHCHHTTAFSLCRIHLLHSCLWLSLAPRWNQHPTVIARHMGVHD